ncbi:Fe-S cluster assembly ATPase SufC [Apilactobacillus kunkeei]|uniref:ABC superfamily ATP binding cassette transporter, ABC protein n=1 Tax=Apilactobacillus kunkeei TaxID=148814 RepID=A0A0N0CU85_9LACO|nr:Fe-S cluster assembly ATPase SufC [Apilactobacillus kunkeei]KOY79741.1 ABC superfamily ATP binding cassette transporter, ABC protein [Apilactobacillus kunkeei]
MTTLEVKDLHVSFIDEEEETSKEILKGVNLTIRTGETHAIMGPNGTGKSTLSETIMGNSNYTITQGDILIDGESILDKTVDERARAGLFLAMQYPAEIKGITNAEFIQAAVNARRNEDNPVPVGEFIDELDHSLKILNMSQEMVDRYLNEGFSGGEKKRNEILQMMMIKPKFSILDEIDSGLDIDALQVVSRGVNSMDDKELGTLMITHYQRILNYIKPDFVHVMMGGRIVKTGDSSLAAELENNGYASLRDELGLDINLTDEDV